MPTPKKKIITGQQPVKKWLSLNEASAYMDMSVSHFRELAITERITTSAIGQKKYYKVAQLDGLIESSVIIR